MEIKVVVSDEKLKEAASALLADMFRPPRYSDEKGGIWYEIVKKQTIETITGMDFREVIIPAIEELKNRVARDVVETSLRTMVKKAISEMKKEGTLFEEKP